MDIEYKSAQIGGISDEGNGEFDAILSTPTVDREGDSFKVDEWADLPKSIPIDVDHSMTVEKTIGVGTPYKSADSIKVHVKLAGTPLAQQVRGMLKDGIINSVSVGYRTLSDSSKGVKRELLNAGVVNTPANPDAVITGVKGVETKAGARNSAQDAAAIQKIHDHAVSLGAKCNAKSDTNIDTKSSEGNASADSGESESEHEEAKSADTSTVDTVASDKDTTASTAVDDADLLLRIKAIGILSESIDF